MLLMLLMPPFVIRYVADQYETQEMCDKVILENGGMIMFVCDYYKNQKMINKAVDNYALALEFVLVAIRHKKCAINLSGLIILQHSSFLNVISLKSNV